jgi:hypothetical protein
MARGRQGEMVDIELLFGESSTSTTTTDVVFGRPTGPDRRKWWIVAAVLVAILLVATGMGSANKRRRAATATSTTVRPTPTTTEVSPPVTPPTVAPPTTESGQVARSEVVSNGDGTTSTVIHGADGSTTGTIDANGVFHEVTVDSPTSVAPTTTTIAPSHGFFEHQSDVQLESPGRVIGPVLPFGAVTGTALYLPTNGPGEVLIYDIDTGVRQRVELPGGYFQRALEGPGGVYVDGSVGGGGVVRVGPAEVTRVGSSADQFGGWVGLGVLAAPGPDGLLWLHDKPSERLMLIDEQGPVGPEFSLPKDADLIGSMADGRPVVRGADMRSFIVETTGARSPLGSGTTSFVDHGRYTETVCDRVQRCTTSGHIDGLAKPIALPSAAQATFQPDGTWAAVVRDQGGKLTLLNAATGEEREVDVSRTQYFGGPAWLAGGFDSSAFFLPNGLGLAVVSDFSVSFVDMNGHTVGSVRLSSDGSRIAGIGSPLR